MRTKKIMSQYIFPLLLFTLFLAGCKATEVITTQPEVASAPDTVEVAIPEETEIREEINPYRPSRTLYHDLIHTRLEVSFDWEKHYLYGTATLELRPYFYPQDTLVLDAKSFEIHSVALLDNNQTRPLNYNYDGRQLAIALGRNFSNDESYFVQIGYTAKPDEGEIGGSAAITSDKGLYFIGTGSTVFGQKPMQIWTQGETEANSHWFPTIDTPNERSSQEIYITVDNRFKTLSNGVLVYSQMESDSTRTDYWRLDQPHAPYLFMMAIGEYAIVKDSWRDIPVEYYVEPAYEPYAKDIFGNTPEMMQFFSDKLGVRYPWPKYAQVVVRDYVSGAMENTTASTFMEALQVDNRELLDYNWDGIIAHELFHHWFGDLVTCESWANLPLNESFASYSEYLWSEYKYGKDEADYVLWEQGQNYFQEAQIKQVDLIRFHYDDREEMFDRHSYDKGSRILHMLRNFIGDEAFFASLHHYLEKHAFQSVEVHDLRLAFEDVTGQDLNWFFNQWFLNSGHPQLKIEHQYKKGLLTVNVVQLQNPDGTPVYRLPVQLEVWSGNQKWRFNAEIEDTESVFEFEVGTEPDVVIFDPDAVLLAQVQHEQSPEELMLQFQKSDNFIRQYESLIAVLEDTMSINNETKLQLLSEALQNDYWVIRQYAVNAVEDMAGRANQDLIKQLVEIAQQDLKSLVRADAISALATMSPQAYKEIFKEGLKDLSYAVNGASLAAYAQTDADDKAALFERFVKYDNVNVVIALADYYVNESIPDKYDWFVQKFLSISNESLYYLLNYFTRYLEVTNSNQVDEGIRLLSQYAQNHPEYYIRLTAYRSLGFFSDRPGVDKLREKIKKNEKDEKLQLIYQSIP